jgi:hypothetical protein
MFKCEGGQGPRAVVRFQVNVNTVKTGPRAVVKFQVNVNTVKTGPRAVVRFQVNVNTVKTGHISLKIQQEFSNYFRPAATFTFSYRIAGHKVINEGNLLKRNGLLLKTVSIISFNQISL